MSPQKVFADYNSTRIIDDAVFLDASAMSISSIQEFLRSKGSGIATMPFYFDCPIAGATAETAYKNIGAPCGQSASASQIIYYAAQIYGVNPKVILATLQKEQSLITTPNPDSWQINQAMGFGCPDSGGCASNSNFFYQVDNGTWSLRFHMERARGNMSYWFNSTSWVCGTAKNYYSPNLYPSQNVNFYDDSGVLYSTINIANAATSAFYCYTPHVYNNPQGLYGLPRAGTTGQYYSGSYNFVYYFERWFGSTIAQPYAQRYVSQSPYPSLKLGGDTTLQITYKNVGAMSWYDDQAISKGLAPSWVGPTRLGTDAPINRHSEFGVSWGGDQNRATGLFAKVFDANGIPYTTNPHIVKPGESVEFNLIVTASLANKGGIFREYFRPVTEGVGYIDGSPVFLDITVEPPIYHYSFVGQSAYPTVKQNSTVVAFYKLRNDGNMPLYDNASVPQGLHPFVLAATAPNNRYSKFNAVFDTPNRPSILFSSVENQDGSPATNQHVALPGQILTFTFTFTVPQTVSEGVYREIFQPILEGADAPIFGSSLSHDLTVAKSSFVATYVEQSPYPVINRGGTSSAYFKYKNTGDQDWYDVSSAPHGLNPVVLATAIPTNRMSNFNLTFATPNRPAINFSSVTNADGSVSQNQHIVKPGQIATFTFAISVPSTTAPKVYQEWFQLLLEGGSPADMGAYCWLGVTIN